jgi:hypothetical protein
MKPFIYSLAFAALLTTGCSHQYVVRMTNGSRITTSSKPKLDRGYYTFKDAKGNQQRVQAGRIKEIAPADMATDERSKFKTASPK